MRPINVYQCNDYNVPCRSQLDIRTKLCIRDSLYRLAKSAEQRHNNYAEGNGSIGDDVEACKAMMAQDPRR